jgi:Raf kinase inhibitor-like YbhB/YbcL family protein
VRIAFGIGLLGLALVSGGCSASGPSGAASTPASSPGATSSQAPGSNPTAGPSTPAGSTATETTMPTPTPFTLTSTAFRAGTPIPARYTCDGADVSPDLEWTGAPAGTRALALIVQDPDAHDFLHWLAFDIEGAPDGRLGAAVAPSADVPGQGMNGFGKRGYGGPCPPSGTHRYRFTLYALDGPLGLSGTPRLAAVEAAMKGHVLGQVTLEATYRRG